MRTRLFVAGLALIVVVSAHLAAEGQKRQTITGVAVDAVSYIVKGEYGEAHTDAGRYRAESGFPVGIVDPESGTLTIAIYRNPAPASGLETANKKLLDLMGKEVVAQGRLFERGGVRLIEISVVSEM